MYTPSGNILAIFIDLITLFDSSLLIWPLLAKQASLWPQEIACPGLKNFCPVAVEPVVVRMHFLSLLQWFFRAYRTYQDTLSLQAQILSTPSTGNFFFLMFFSYLQWCLPGSLDDWLKSAQISSFCEHFHGVILSYCGSISLFYLSLSFIRLVRGLSVLEDTLTALWSSSSVSYAISPSPGLSYPRLLLLAYYLNLFSPCVSALIFRLVWMKLTVW